MKFFRRLCIFITILFALGSILFLCFAEELPVSQKIEEAMKKVAMEYVIFSKNATPQVLSAPQILSDPQNLSIEANEEADYEIDWEKTLFIGDSLLKGMDNTCGIQKLGTTVNAKVGRPISKGASVLSDYSGYKNVVIVLGTNDCGAIKSTFKQNTINTIRKAKESNPDAHIYINTMPPINDSKAKTNGYSARNSMVVNNNKMIVEAASEEGITVIDSYGLLTESGYSTRDGIHMQSDTYEIWFEEIKNILEGRE